MSSNGPLIEADALRKNVNGIDLGSMPASLTCEAKLVICATTRHGARHGRQQLEGVDRHRVGAVRGGVDGGAVGEQFAGGGRGGVDLWLRRSAVWTHQASAVRRTEMVMSWLLSVGRRRRVRSNSLLARSAVMHRKRFVG